MTDRQDTLREKLLMAAKTGVEDQGFHPARTDHERAEDFLRLQQEQLRVGMLCSDLYRIKVWMVLICGTAILALILGIGMFVHGRNETARARAVMIFDRVCAGG